MVRSVAARFRAAYRMAVTAAALLTCLWWQREW